MKRNICFMTVALAVAMLFSSCSKEKYTITVHANDPTMGTVTGGGEYKENSQVTIEAKANEGYTFISWNDNITDNPRTIIVTSDASYTAIFEPIDTNTYYTITVEVNDPAMGSATGGGTYIANTEATLTATPEMGYDFVAWNDGNTENPRTIVVTGDATYTANFQQHFEDGATVSFQGNTWIAASIGAFDFSSDGYLTFYIFKTANDQNDVYLRGWLENTPGNYNFDSTGDYFLMCDNNNLWIDEDGIIGDSGSSYYHWQVDKSTFVEHITAVDLNNKTINATWSEDMFSIEDYVENGGTPTQFYPLSCQMVNATWTWQSASKNADRKGFAPKFVAVK